MGIPIQIGDFSKSDLHKFCPTRPTTTPKNLVLRYCIGNYVQNYQDSSDCLNRSSCFHGFLSSAKKGSKFRYYFDCDRKFCVGKFRLRLIKGLIAQQQESSSLNPCFCG